MENTKNKFADMWTNTKNVWNNASEFVNAVCLGAVSGFSLYQAYQHIDSPWYKALFFAGAVIALQALQLLVRHFNRPVAPVKKK